MDPHAANYVAFAAAHVRGARSDAPSLPDLEIVAWGREQGLRLHRYKRNASLPRVREALGILRGLRPDSIVDLGTGRGTFLWPLLDGMPEVSVTAVEQHPERAERLRCVSLGGVERLTVLTADVTELPLPADHSDVVTALEVLEHLEQPELAAAEAVRVARRFVVASVPSHADDNPEHIQLFTPQSLTEVFLRAGALRASVSSVRGHHVAVVKVPS